MFDWVVLMIDSWGYVGVFLLMVVEYLFLLILFEVIMLLVGFLVV